MVVVVVTKWSASLFLLWRRYVHIFFSSVLRFVVESSRKRTFSSTIKRSAMDASAATRRSSFPAAEIVPLLCKYVKLQVISCDGHAKK